MSDEHSDLSYIAFKDEGTTDGGEPIGPVSFVTKADEELTGVAALMGGPREECECQEPDCEPGERCRRCGKENERWVTLSQAEEIARRRGVVLREE
ncbi:MAG: hypothetical protein AB7V58_01200 [Solirubrobacterales bacterium]